MANAPQVKGSTSAIRRLTVRSREATPNSLRSTIEIVPTTSTIARTWTDSIHGKMISFSLIVVATAVACSHPRTRSSSTGKSLIMIMRQAANRSVRSGVIGDPTAGEDDRGPQQHRDNRDRGRSDPRPGAQIAKSRIAPLQQLKQPGDDQGRNQQGHLDLE